MLFGQNFIFKSKNNIISTNLNQSNNIANILPKVRI